MVFYSILQKNSGKRIVDMIINRSLIRRDFSSLQFLNPSPIILKISLFSNPLIMEDISHYIVPLNHHLPTLVHHPRYHLSIRPIKLLFQLFLSCDLPRNTVQRSTLHKCGHKSRYNAFNVVVAAFLQIFWSLPSSPCVLEASFRGGNFVENYYNDPSKQWNHVQQIQGGISPQKVSRLFPTPKVLVGKSQ